MSLLIVPTVIIALGVWREWGRIERQFDTLGIDKFKEVHGYQTGGKLPGYGGGDRNLILAEDGEFIVRKEVARRYEPVLERMNQGGPLYANNGGYYGTDSRLQTENNSRGNHFIDRNGTPISRTSKTVLGTEISEAKQNEIFRSLIEGRDRRLHSFLKKYSSTGGILYASRGRYTNVNDIADENLRDFILRRLMARDIDTGLSIEDDFPGLSNLLVDPYMKAAKLYDAPVELFTNMKLGSESFTGVFPNYPVIVGRDNKSPVNYLTFNKDRKGTDPLEYTATAGIHDLGHVFSNYKSFLYSSGIDFDQKRIPNVPQSKVGIGLQSPSIEEAFGELIKHKFSSGKYDPVDFVDTDGAKGILKKFPLSSILESEGHYTGYMLAPAVLRIAEEQGQYSDLIYNYNNVVRALESGNLNEVTKYRDVLNSMIFRKHGGPIKFAQGGKIPGYGGGDRIPILAEAGEYIVNKQAAKRYHSVLEYINGRGQERSEVGREIRGFQGGGSVGGYHASKDRIIFIPLWLQPL